MSAALFPAAVRDRLRAYANAEGLLFRGVVDGLLNTPLCELHLLHEGVLLHHGQGATWAEALDAALAARHDALVRAPETWDRTRALGALDALRRDLDALRAHRLRQFYFAWTIPVRNGHTFPRAALQTDVNGRFLHDQTDVEYATRWGSVRAASLAEARARFERGEVDSWGS